MIKRALSEGRVFRLVNDDSIRCQALADEKRATVAHGDTHVTPEPELRA